MGLLQKLSDKGIAASNETPPLMDKPVIQKKSNSVGLLKKSLMAGETLKLDFFDFAGKHNLEIAAILKNQDNTFTIQNCVGFDGESIFLSVSTSDFWEGTIKQQNKLYSFDATSSEALPFFQFFSKQLKEKLTNIQIIKTINNSIFLICNNSIQATPDFIKEIESVEATEISFENNINKSDNYANTYIIDFSEALESFVVSNSNNNNHFDNVILNEIYHNLCINFPTPQYIEFDLKGQFKLHITEELPVELIYNHIRIENNFILGNHSELLSIRDENSSVEAEH